MRISSQELLDVALAAANDAAEVIRAGLERPRSDTRITHKGAVDLVTQTDLAAEQAVLEIIRAKFPDHRILAEESGDSGPAGESYCWVIDPLDGTTNFAHKIPHCAVSIACLADGQPVVGVVVDPARRECFAATSSTPTTLNGRSVAVSPTPSASQSIFATGFMYDRRERSSYYLRKFEAFMKLGHGMRRMGAAALDLAWVACGRFDGFFEEGLKPWDVSAGALLVRMAGGEVSDYAGNPLDVMQPTALIASNGRIHQEMVETMKPFEVVQGHT
ncbi:MAG: inositol monophosphatase [Myxococcales bacterium]|nr:inositol monophosphatase [Myxococcales bacterium]